MPPRFLAVAVLAVALVALRGLGVCAAVPGDDCALDPALLCDTPDSGLACVDGRCQACLAGTDDGEGEHTVRSNSSTPVAPNGGCGAAFRCENRIDDDGSRMVCVRAPLFSSQTAGLTWVGLVCLFVGSALAAGGGLGGGGIFVPLLILMVGLSPKEAVPISQAMIFGGSIVNLVMNYRSRHALVATRPLIDYDAVLILEPLMLLGTTVGVLLNTMCPTWLIVVILVLVIGYGAVRTSRRGLRQFRKERRARLAAKDQSGTNKNARWQEEGEEKEESSDAVGIEMRVMDDASSSGSAFVGKLEPKAEHVASAADDRELSLNCCSAGGCFIYASLPSPSRSMTSATSSNNDNSSKARRRQSIAVRESKQAFRLAMVMCMLVLIIVLSLIRGGKAGAASVVGIENCSGEYWGVTALTFAILVVIAIFVGRHLSKQHDEKLACGYVFVDGDIAWTGRNVYLYPALSAFAGMCGGLLGIGGGMIMGPLLLELGMLPGNTQGTSATTVLITSGAAMFQFLFLGMLIPDYGAFFACAGLVATFIGQTVLDYLVKKYKTTSFIVFSIAAVMVIAVILMAIAGIIRIVAEVESGQGGGFTPLC